MGCAQPISSLALTYRPNCSRKRGEFEAGRRPVRAPPRPPASRRTAAAKGTTCGPLPTPERPAMPDPLADRPPRRPRPRAAARARQPPRPHHRRHRHRQDRHAAGAWPSGCQRHRRAGVHGRRQGRPRRHQPGRARRRPSSTERLKLIGADAPAFAGCPVVFWDVFGEQGHPVRATVSDLGPLLLARILNLNETQEGVLTLVFKIADDNGLLLLDLKDLRAMLQYVGDNAQQFQTQLRQRLGGVDRRDPARPARARAAGRRQVPRRADAQRRRPAADRRRHAAWSTSSPPTG